MESGPSDGSTAQGVRVDVGSTDTMRDGNGLATATKSSKMETEATPPLAFHLNRLAAKWGQPAASGGDGVVGIGDILR